MNIFGFTIEISRQNSGAAATDEPQHSQPQSAWKATHMHRKGGAYRFLYEGVLEADRTPVVIYDDREGQVWVRSNGEFHDGRFQSTT